MTDVQQKVQALLDRAVAEGRENGIQVAVYYKGDLVADAWAGRKVDTGEPVDGDTLFPVFSTTKGITATLAHILAKQGKLDYDRKIADIWPGFGVNGKKGITVRHALTHSAGLPYMPAIEDPRETGDWSAMCDKIAALNPQYAPGEKFIYHALTYGWIVGEVLRILDGRGVAQMLREEITERIGAPDMYMGVPPEAERRVAKVSQPGFDADALTPEELSQIPESIWPLSEWMNKPESWRACIPAGNGLANARSLARIYASLLPYGADGVCLLPEDIIERATERYVQADGAVTAQALGYVVDHENGNRLFGHGGFGGSNAYADRACGYSFALTKNLFTEKEAGPEIISEIQKMMRSLSGRRSD